MMDINDKNRVEAYAEYIASLRARQGFWNGASRITDILGDLDKAPLRHPPVPRDPQEANRSLLAAIANYFRESFLSYSAAHTDGQKEK